MSDAIRKAGSQNEARRGIRTDSSYEEFDDGADLGVSITANIIAHALAADNPHKFDKNRFLRDAGVTK